MLDEAHASRMLQFTAACRKQEQSSWYRHRISAVLKSRRQLNPWPVFLVNTWEVLIVWMQRAFDTICRMSVLANLPSILVLKKECKGIGIYSKSLFVSVIHSRNMLIIQSTYISKWISSTVGSVVIMWCLASYTTSIARSLLIYQVKIC